MTEVVSVGGHEVAISHADRLVFPAANLTKLDLARYYVRIAGMTVPHVREQPLALQSFPEGVESAGYFLKHVPRHFPKWIQTVPVAEDSPGIEVQSALDIEPLRTMCSNSSLERHLVAHRRPSCYAVPPTVFEEIAQVAPLLGAAV
ncbi:MAG: hypothetical protein ACRDV9_13750 [Acidimicrobiia bacterium]